MNAIDDLSDEAVGTKAGRKPRLRFTIRGVMIATAILAVALALPKAGLVVAVALAIPCLSLWLAGRLLAWGERGLARFFFWVPAILVNVLFVYLGTWPEPILYILLFLVSFFIFLPTLGGFGIAWAILATQGVRGPARAPTRTWFAVLILTLMPSATALTAWPFRLEFLLARPALERLADQVAAGRPITTPQWAGRFRLAGSAVDTASGNVALLFAPNGPRALVRIGPRARLGECGSPVQGDWSHLPLTFGWCFHQED